jgi:hypothetical protein
MRQQATMAILSFPEASAAVGCSRQHLYRLVSKGRVSAVIRPDGTRGIDTSELIRVFGNLSIPATEKATGDSHQATRGDSRLQQVTGQDATILELEVKHLREALKVADDRLREAQDREQKLLELLSSQTRLLEHKATVPSQIVTQPPSSPGPEIPPKARKSEGIRVNIPTLGEYLKD